MSHQTQPKASVIMVMVMALGTLLAISVSLGGCVTPETQEPGFVVDAPIRLRPAARELVGARLGEVVVETDTTVANVLLETQLIRRVAQVAKPAVVSIYIKAKSPHRVRLLPFLPGFRVQLPGAGLGSGFLIHPTGYVLTNNHVIEGAEEMRVITRSGLDLEAIVIARDPTFDLALLKVPTRGRAFPVLPMGDSGMVAAGDQVIAVGNPLGLGHSVTAGIISQTGRDLSGVPTEAGRRVAFLQTDTAINPGSSGGPLITLTGAWVGVNTAGVTQAQNIGFAVPSRQVREFLEEVLAGEGVPEPADD